MKGFDVDSTIVGAQRSWLLGDILHSRPLVFNYTDYTTADENYCPESPNPSTGKFNSSVLYVGANDGMVHAFRDCDGREMWAFVPPQVLKSLQATVEIHRQERTRHGDPGGGEDDECRGQPRDERTSETHL